MNFIIILYIRVELKKSVLGQVSTHQSQTRNDSDFRVGSKKNFFNFLEIFNSNLKNNNKTCCEFFIKYGKFAFHPAVLATAFFK